ncbi:MAG: methionine synthase [Clostridium sp.]|nr:methionine synthase [Clostridium sp.]
MVLDGAMGTMIQRLNLSEEDFRGSLPLPEDVKFKGCNDLLCLTRPDAIRHIHEQYLEAGADIIETNSFNANAISMVEYRLQDRVWDINIAASRQARQAAEEYMHKTGRQVYVAGSMGPSNVALSIPGASTVSVNFDNMASAYFQQATALIEGGVDILLLETVFDTLNAKAALSGIRRAIDECGHEVSLMISATLTPRGRTISGQSVEAFIAAMRHSGAVSVGLNCGFGAEGMERWLKKLQNIPQYVSLHPNAGLPDELGRYTETPSRMANVLRKYLEAGMINIVGGCCGTTPSHIRAIAQIAHKAEPRKPQPADPKSRTLTLAGLDALEVVPGHFLKVGERCNVAGSRKFLRLIREGNTSEALQIAASQVGSGAEVLDINMDDGLLNAELRMETFVSLLSTDSTTSPLPLMIDSSSMQTIRVALKKFQGVAIVNSISLKEGEEKFIATALEIKQLGAVPVVMAFDEKGQATTLPRRIEICSRAYKILTEECGFPGYEIIFDPNVLTIATGIADHDRYALDFLDTISWIKENLPGAKVSGGVSNLSFSFRGNDTVRKAMHTVFLHHAIERGLDMAIVNPATSTDIATVEPTLREHIEDVIFMRRTDAVDRLLILATDIRNREQASKKGTPKTPPADAPKRSTSLTLAQSVEQGVDSELEALVVQAIAAEGSAMKVVERHLMEGIRIVGDKFGAGEMFLPQVVRAASVMKKAVDILTPEIEKENSAKGTKSETSANAIPTFVLATVKGDVHDIGKNIVAIILKCSGFNVIDLGVMVEGEKIVEAVRRYNAKFVGLSGLIAPSLAEMADVATLLEREGLSDVTLCIGGATTSELHTAVKIAPLFSGLTLHTRDAAQLPPVVASLTDSTLHAFERERIRSAQKRLSEEFYGREEREVSDTTPLPTRKSNPSAVPKQPGLSNIYIPIEELIYCINWKEFLHVWHLSPKYATLAQYNESDSIASAEQLFSEDTAAKEAGRLLSDAREMLRELINRGVAIHTRAVLTPAYSAGDSIYIRCGEEEIELDTPRRTQAPRTSLADQVAAEDDYIGVFTATALSVLRESEKIYGQQATDYQKLLTQSLADRLVEAASERMHTEVHEELWGLSDIPRGIRPAVGYPSLPDQRIVFKLDKLLHYSELGITLTENGALHPQCTTTGLILSK